MDTMNTAIYPTAPALTHREIEAQATRFAWDFLRLNGKRPRGPVSWAKAAARMAGHSGVDAEVFAVTAARVVRA